MDGPLIDLNGISYAYVPDRPVLQDVSFRLCAGDRMGLVGGNGSGKTTLLHVIAGLLRPQSGTVCLFGRERRNEREFREVRAKLGLVFQDADDQLFCPTVLEDVAFGPLNQDRTPDEARRVARETLARIGLDGFEDRITYRLSGGEKRLVALATVLSMQPDILLLDEPTNGLDDNARSRVIKVLQDIPQSLLVVSHDTSLIQQVTHTRSLLEKGRLL